MFILFTVALATTKVLKSLTQNTKCGIRYQFVNDRPIFSDGVATTNKLMCGNGVEPATPQQTKPTNDQTVILLLVVNFSWEIVGLHLEDSKGPRSDKILLWTRIWPSTLCLGYRLWSPTSQCLGCLWICDQQRKREISICRWLILVIASIYTIKLSYISFSDTFDTMFFCPSCWWCTHLLSWFFVSFNKVWLFLMFEVICWPCAETDTCPLGYTQDIVVKSVKIPTPSDGPDSDRTINYFRVKLKSFKLYQDLWVQIESRHLSDRSKLGRILNCKLKWNFSFNLHKNTNLMCFTKPTNAGPQTNFHKLLEIKTGPIGF